MLIFDGSPDSYDDILRVLDYFAHISGLKKISKTKIVWIGVKSFLKKNFTILDRVSSSNDLWCGIEVWNFLL